MGKLYAQIDVNLPDDGKIIEAGDLAELAYIRCILRARQHLTDGVVDRKVVDRWLIGIRGRSATHMQRLVNAGLLVEHEKGWAFPPAVWQAWNPTKAQVDAKREAEAERKRDWRSRQRPANVPPGQEVASAARDALSETETETETETEKTPLPPTDAQPALSTASEEGVLGIEGQRIAAAASAYARLVIGRTPDVRSPNAFANVTIAKVMTRSHPDPRVTVPEIVHYVRLFPDAPPGDIALWLDGSKGTMCRYRRADETPDGQEVTL